MNNQIKTIVLVLLMGFVSIAFAFEGEVNYEIVDGSPDNGIPKSQFKLSIADSLLKIDYIFFFPGGHGTTTAYLDYKNGVGTFVKNNKKEIVNIRETFKNRRFLAPEELIKTGNTKSISETKTEEYETFYFVYKNRYPLKSWYSIQTFPGTFYPVWHLFNIHPDMSLANFFINPITRHISYEITFDRGQGKKTTFRLIKIQRKSFNPHYFKP